MTKIYNTIDTWACRHEISDKSMTYHTLFLRKAEDVRAKAPQLGRLNAMLKATTPDIGKPVKELIAGLKLRATITKTLMKSFGDDNKSQEEKDAIKKFCDIVDDGTLPKFPPADDDPVFPFLGGVPER
ncbi:hypothetical protein TWF970_007791 [Orbilia oligospora]|uniref:Uncharacterized protein n=1 Tax=Orbilia oligospora TaxID=2813651 RepID=A0A7C8VIN6_ORBOL|nr:hypothetical protein TWF970_007791 [Orbilia oligospora]